MVKLGTIFKAMILAAGSVMMVKGIVNNFYQAADELEEAKHELKRENAAKMTEELKEGLGEKDYNGIFREDLKEENVRLTTGEKLKLAVPFVLKCAASLVVPLIFINECMNLGAGGAVQDSMIEIDPDTVSKCVFKNCTPDFVARADWHDGRKDYIFGIHRM